MAGREGWIDVSVPIRTGMVVFEGDPEVSITRAASIADGDLANVSRLDMGAHTGTHIDAPVHFIAGAPGIESVPPDALIGPAFVADARAVTGAIDEGALATMGIPEETERVLFRTNNSALWDLPAFSRDFAGLTEGAARGLVRRGVRLAGIDYLSIAPFGEPGPTHRALLAAGVVILEGLDLRHVEPGAYDLVCLPLRIPGSDGAPARALVRRR